MFLSNAQTIKGFDMKKILPIIFSLLALQNAFAQGQAEPTACPGISAIASVGVDTPFNANGSWNVGKQSNNYGTPQSWSFIALTGLDADEVSSAKATEFANDNLSTYQSVEGPLDFGDEGAPEWWCFYRPQGSSNYGVAITPVQQLPDQAERARKYFAK